MSSSPSPGPPSPFRVGQERTKQVKRARTNITGRPLPLSRLLETLSPDQLRGVLQTVCDRHPDIGREINTSAPNPSVPSTLSILHNYENAFKEAFPYGDRPSSDYAFNRVRPTLTALLDALKDFTPHFLPPNETQSATSLTFLDGATDIIHNLPEWDSMQHNRHKEDAYEEMAKAWSAVIKEAIKKGGGLQLQYNGWDQKLVKHNQASGGKMTEALSELKASLGWKEGATGFGGAGAGSGEGRTIRDQLWNNTYGASPIAVGPWGSAF